MSVQLANLVPRSLCLGIFSKMLAGAAHIAACNISPTNLQLFNFFLLSYKKTQETLSQAGQKTSAALSNVGSVISRKLGDMR